MLRATNPTWPLRARFATLAAAFAVFILLLSEVLAFAGLVSPALGLRSALTFVVIVAIALPGLSHSHPHGTLGYANWVTTFRSSLVALVGALLLEPTSRTVAWTTVVVASVAAVLDGWDGWLARRTRMESAFGARFDMEIDALLILLLSLVVWRYEKAGAWIVLSGALRYVFVVAGLILPWMNEPLLPSTRRKAVCVIQIVALIVAIGPIIVSPLSTLIAAVSLLVLIWSFAVDVAWLRKAFGASS